MTSASVPSRSPTLGTDGFAGYQGELFYTDDDGVSWAEHDLSTLGERLYAIVLRDGTHDWAVGQTGTIIACTNDAEPDASSVATTGSPGV